MMVGHIVVETQPSCIDWEAWSEVFTSSQKVTCAGFLQRIVQDTVHAPLSPYLGPIALCANAQSRFGTVMSYTHTYKA